jgi:hypothetical protein
MFTEGIFLRNQKREYDHPLAPPMLSGEVQQRPAKTIYNPGPLHPLLSPDSLRQADSLREGTHALAEWISFIQQNSKTSSYETHPSLQLNDNEYSTFIFVSCTPWRAWRKRYRPKHLR